MNSIFEIGDVTKIIAGGDKPKIFSESINDNCCIPVVGNAEGENGLLGYTDIARILEPSVTISARGSKVGFTSIRKKPFFPIVRLLTLIPDKKILDVNYLYYTLKQYQFGGTGSGQPQITVPQIANKPISIPILSTQQKIAAVLSALDDKIELNNKINAELEAMAKTLYDYWFVQFEFPNVEGKPYKSSGGKMVYNDVLKREIPEGWEVKELKEISRIIMGQSPKGESYNENGEGILLINGAADYEGNYLKPRIYTSSPTRLCEENDLIFCIRATIGKLTYAEQQFCLGRGVAGVRVNYLEYLEYVYYSLNQEIERFKKHASGSIIVGITKDDLTDYNVLIPSKELLNIFHQKTNPIHVKIRSNLKQNQELAQLRDWLLPMLMNGQVKVSDVYEK